MSAEIEPSARLDRAGLAAGKRSVLNRGGWGNPDVLLIELTAGRVVVKDFGPRGPWVRRWLGPWLLRREERAYRRLGDFDAVPRLLGRVDDAALVFEYRPGVYLSRSLAGTLPETFLEDLQAAIAEMHRRGIVHLDLRHRSNILAGEDGRPVLLDFATALHFDSSRRSGRILIGLLGWFDRRALQKWRARLA